MLDTTIGFIGGGNMARSLIGGVLSTGFDPSKVIVSTRSEERLNALKETFNCVVCNDNKKTISQSNIIVLAVKPYQLKSVCEELKRADIGKDKLIVSVAAAVTINLIGRWCGNTMPIVRTMPNTPCAVGAGVTGLFANSEVSEKGKDQVESLFRAVGTTIWVEHEDQLDAITALTGSGPAYVFKFMEALENAAVKMGFSTQQSRLLIEQLLIGSAKMAVESDGTAQDLRRQVTSPGGTTEKAIEKLKEHDFDLCIDKAVNAAKQKACELAWELEQKEGNI